MPTLGAVRTKWAEEKVQFPIKRFNKTLEGQQINSVIHNADAMRCTNQLHSFGITSEIISIIIERQSQAPSGGPSGDFI